MLARWKEVVECGLGIDWVLADLYTTPRRRATVKNTNIRSWPGRLFVCVNECDAGYQEGSFLMSRASGWLGFLKPDRVFVALVCSNCGHVQFYLRPSWYKEKK